MPSQASLTLTPLGGMGEIGMNCTMWSTDTTTVIVDCGLMFPHDYHLGVDVIIPQFEHILNQKEKVKGIVLTHGHEDHIGALPWLIRWLSVPIYGSRFTLALVESKLREAELLHRTELIPVSPRERIQLGDMAFNFFPVCHSIIEGYGIGVETPAGKVVHTGDFKLDRTPLDNHRTDLEGFHNFSKDGVELLLSDSTNIEREGYSLSERDIKSAFEDLFANAKGRIIVTLFSSHIQRIQQVLDISARYGRKIAVSGRSLVKNIEIANELGFLRIRTPVYMDTREMPELPDEETVLLLTGSQGEPLSALSRIARGEHKHLAIQEGDTVVMSSRVIPGNTLAITRMINDMYRMGAEVFYESFRNIHASGHAYREELCEMLNTVSPKHFIPVHGEYRHLVKHCRLAQECGVEEANTLIVEDGQPVTLCDGTLTKETPLELEEILVDGKGVGDVGLTVLKERQILGGEGMVVVFMVLDEQIWEILHGPTIVSKGFVFEAHFDHVLEDAKCIILELLENIGPEDIELLQDRIRSGLRRFFRKVLERDPVVVPVITMV
ncbi:ribonuclease J [Halodesulfovibrio sp.]|jgi:ribonuclease J|uniref:ribonuclease J n=1 Tax=Halodesulfovibrio sp. TaxID=1912772 RepID=UPI002600973D|nr:ribonuclease J [Halodesulfovibrio sp.]MCT4535489.1 ribonuclease J [Halodesulfovibrio sp.]MCT4626303.1 ribonuclease J [Halodesulfovibrio sp.]